MSIQGRSLSRLKWARLTLIISLVVIVALAVASLSGPNRRDFDVKFSIARKQVDIGRSKGRIGYAKFARDGLWVFIDGGMLLARFDGAHDYSPNDDVPTANTIANVHGYSKWNEFVATTNHSENKLFVIPMPLHKAKRSRNRICMFDFELRKWTTKEINNATVLESIQRISHIEESDQIAVVGSKGYSIIDLKHSHAEVVREQSTPFTCIDCGPNGLEIGLQPFPGVPYAGELVLANRGEQLKSLLRVKNVALTRLLPSQQIVVHAHSTGTITEVHLWNVTDARLVTFARVSEISGVSEISISKDGKWLALFGMIGKRLYVPYLQSNTEPGVALYHLPTQKCVRLFRSVAFYRSCSQLVIDLEHKKLAAVISDPGIVLYSDITKDLESVSEPD